MIKNEFKLMYPVGDKKYISSDLALQNQNKELHQRKLYHLMGFKSNHIENTYNSKRK